MGNWTGPIAQNNYCENDQSRVKYGIITNTPARRSPRRFFCARNMESNKQSAERLARRLAQTWGGKAKFWVECNVRTVTRYNRQWKECTWEVKSDLVNGMPR